MVTLLDTSAMVAGLVPSHPRHIWATPYLAQPNLHMCAHSLAELYSVLSGSPQFRIATADAARMVARVAANLSVVELDAEMYQRAVNRVSALNLAGGAIYDALIAEAAISINAEQLVTLNPKHFVRLSRDIARRIVAPDT